MGQEQVGYSVTVILINTSTTFSLRHSFSSFYPIFSRVFGRIFCHKLKTPSPVVCDSFVNWPLYCSTNSVSPCFFVLQILTANSRNVKNSTIFMHLIVYLHLGYLLRYLNMQNCVRNIKSKLHSCINCCIIHKVPSTKRA